MLKVLVSLQRTETTFKTTIPLLRNLCYYNGDISLQIYAYLVCLAYSYTRTRLQRH